MNIQTENSVNRSILCLFPCRHESSAAAPEAPAKMFIVAEHELLKLFQRCGGCRWRCNIETKVKGSIVNASTWCDCCEHHTSWTNEPLVNKRAQANLQLCAAICFSGASPEKLLRLLEQAAIQVPSTRTYYLYQRHLFQPAIGRVRRKEHLMVQKFIYAFKLKVKATL